MNTETGEIIGPTLKEKAIEDLMKKDGLTRLQAEAKFIEMTVPPTQKQIFRGKVGRNELCPCGSGEKFKNCHWTGR